MNLEFASLFTGIGGIDLGFEHAGWTCVLQVENHPFARRVLRKHWPHVLRQHDVNFARIPQRIGALVGGFPCQDLSSANVKGRERLQGKQSGLWAAFKHCIVQAQPEWVVIENVGKTWRDWMPRVRRDLWRRGYASVPFLVRAADVGAPHERLRGWVVAAHADRHGESIMCFHAKVAELYETARPRWPYRWQPPSCALGVVDGIPNRMDRLHVVGNAVVPQIPTLFALAIKELVHAQP